MEQREEFLQEAMKRYGDTVYRMALCRLQCVSDAEDVYQDVFLRLWKQDAAEWEAERTKAWLIRTTLNRCADIGRFRLRRPVVSLEEVAEPSAQTEEMSELWETVSKLPDKLRIVVHLHYGEGYQTDEIAAILQIPAVTVRTRLHRARSKLKDLLGGETE